MAGTQSRQASNVNTEINTAGLFTVVEVANDNVIITKGSQVNKWPLRKRYVSFSTNIHLLKRSAFIGYSPDSTLFLVRYTKGREDALVGSVEHYALFDTTIIYITGHYVMSIDISTGDRKIMLENDEKIGPAKILICSGSLLLVSTKIIHRLELSTNMYTKLRLKVTLDPLTAESAKVGEHVELVVSCVKGNLYAFETKTMEIVRRMKYFESPVSAIGFWKPEPSILFILTKAGELIDVDYLNNRIFKKNDFPTGNYTRVIPIKGKAMIFIDGKQVIIYSPYTNTIKTIYKSEEEGEFGYIAVVPEENSPPVFPEKKTKLEGKDECLQNSPDNPKKEKRDAESDLHSLKRQKLSEEENEHEKAKSEAGEGRSPLEIYESFENFKDSVYKVQADILKEVFLLKKRLDEIERALTK